MLITLNNINIYCGILNINRFWINWRSDFIPWRYIYSHNLSMLYKVRKYRTNNDNLSEYTVTALSNNAEMICSIQSNQHRCGEWYYLKKILDTNEDGHGDSYTVIRSKGNHLIQNEMEINGITNKCISVIVKYKDKLFKNKVYVFVIIFVLMSLNQFVYHLRDSININPELMQLQHHTDIIDIYIFFIENK